MVSHKFAQANSILNSNLESVMAIERVVSDIEKLMVTTESDLIELRYVAPRCLVVWEDAFAACKGRNQHAFLTSLPQQYTTCSSLYRFGSLQHNVSNSSANTDELARRIMYSQITSASDDSTLW